MPPSYRRGWGGSFSYEPFDRYKKTTEEQSKFLMGNAVKDAINRVTATVAERALTPIPMREKDNSPWGKFKSAADKVTPEFLERGGEKTLEGLDRWGNLTSGGITSLTTKGYVDANGQYQTQRNIGGNPLKNIQSHAEAQEKAGLGDEGPGWQRGIRAVANAGKAFNEDPDIPAGVKIGVGIASDPTTYLGPGLVRGALKNAPKAIQASKGARFAGAILENPRRATLGASAAAIGAGQIAESTGHENLVGPASLLAGLAGGAATGLTPSRPALAPPPVNRGLTPAVQNAEIDLVAKQARELGDAKTPYRENLARVGKDRDAIAMGRKALLSRLTSEVGKGEIIPEAADSAKWFIRQVPDKYLERLGSSYVKGGDEATIAGQYVKLNGVDEDDGLLRIVKAVTNRSTEPERVIVHEIGHHLEQFVDDADYTALRSQWEREMGLKGGIFPGSGEGGQAIVDAQPALAKSDANGMVTPTEARDANAAYRYTGGFGEWFAENIADRAVRDFEGAADEMGPWKRAWENVKEIAEATYRWLLKRGEKDAAERVYKNILAGKYEAVGRGGGAEVQNLPGDTFRTSKGSEYVVNDDNTTTRNKAARPDFGHEGDEGVKPSSSATYYVKPEDMNLLGEIQSRGASGSRIIEQAGPDHIAIKYLDGKDAGKFERRTVVPFSRDPKVGYHPVEVWRDYEGTGKPGHHFGNDIVSVRNGGAPPVASRAFSDSGMTGPAQAADMNGAAPPPPSRPLPPRSEPGGDWIQSRDEDGRLVYTPASVAARGGTPPPVTNTSLSVPRATQRPAIDLFNTLSPERRLAEEGGFKTGIRGKVDAAARNVAAQVGGEKFDKNLRQGDDTVFTVKEKTRLDGITRSYEATADDLYAQMLQTGIPLKKGKDGVERLPNGAAFPDMFEGKTPAGKAAYAALTPGQQASITAMRNFGDELNANLRFHNQSGTLGWDEAEEAYFPRISIGVDGKPRAHVGGGGRALGTNQPFEKSRTYATFEEGLKEGIDYGDNRQAWKIMARAKMRAAADDYIAKGLKPLGLTEKQLPEGATLGVDYVAIPRDVAPALNGRYFPPEVATRITEALGGSSMIDIKPIRELNKVLTPLRATGDVSWFAQQGAGMLFRHPVKAIEGAAKVLWSATMGDRKTYDKLISTQKKNIRSHIQHGMQWNEADELTPIDYGFVKADTVKGRVASKPGVKQVATGYNKMADFSNQTFGRYMNYVRLTFANDAFERLQAMKKTMSPEDYRKEYMGAMDAVNRITGRTNRKVSSLESMAAFAPTYFSASVEQLAAAVAKGGLEGSIARGHIVRMLAFGGLMAYGINEARGKETEFDPRSSNFMRIRDVGGLDVSAFGTYDTLFRALAGTVAGDEDGGPDITKLWKLAEGKMSPGLKLIYEPFVKRATYTGEPLDPTSLKGVGDIALKQLVAAAPFSVQNSIDSAIQPAWEEKSLKPLAEAIPGQVASMIGTTNAPVTPTEKRNARRDEIAQERFGMKYDALSGTDKSIVNEDEEVSRSQADADKNTMTRADDRSKSQQASIEALTRVNALTERYENGEVDAKEFRSLYHDSQMRLRGSRDALGDKGKGDVIDKWFDLYDQVERPDGSTDYDKLDQLQIEYRAAHPEIDAKLDEITGTRDNETMRRFRVAQDQAQQYYDLPQYQGLSKEEGERAGDVLAIVSRLVGNDQAIGYRQALNWMVQNSVITPEERVLALRAQKVGKSRERKAFETENAEFAEFYRNSIDKLGAVAAPEVGTYANASSSGGGLTSRSRRSSRRGVDVNNLTTRSRRGSLAG